MVSVSNSNRPKPYQHRKRLLVTIILPVCLLILIVLFMIWQLCFFDGGRTPGITATGTKKQQQEKPIITSAIFDESEFEERNKNIVAMTTTTTPKKTIPCIYKGLDSVSADDLHPVAGKQRYLVTPPADGKVSLVCCDTTKGPLSILAHQNWAPLGSKQFVNMVQAGYFNSGIPMMRCVPGFLCQFGLNSDPEQTKKFNKSFPDDPNWLPEGPDHRQNSDGIKRFARGYLAYAGGGKNSRNNQFIVALKNNGPLAGGSPWE